MMSIPTMTRIKLVIAIIVTASRLAIIVVAIERSMVDLVISLMILRIMLR